MQRCDEGGEILKSWVLQLAVVLAVVGVIAYEAISIGMAHLALDDEAREVAASVRNAYGGGSIEEAIEAGRVTAQQHEIEVLGVIEVEQPPEIVFDLRKQASTLLVHRVGLLEGMTHARTSRRIPLGTP